MKRRDLRIVWSSNSLWSNSGYGSFSRDIISRMLEDGWPVMHIAWWGLEGSDVEVNVGQFNPRFKDLKVRVYPRMDDQWGTDAIVAHTNDWKGDVVFTMQDIWTMNPQLLAQVKHWIPYFPIDKFPVPLNIIQRMPYAYRLLTFSQFGHDSLAKSGWASQLILEGIDTALFKPMDRKKLREEYRLNPNWFIFGMIAANKENPPRKGWQEALIAFAQFAKSHPDAYLYIKIQQRAPTGFPIEGFAKYLGIFDRLIWADPYKSVFKGGPSVIAPDMNMIDVLLHPSQTEGFGLTPVEAMSCGTPAIVGGNTSQPELVIDGKTGFIARSDRRRYTADDSFVYEVDPDSLYAQMERAYTALKGKNTIAKDAREHVVKKYNIDSIYKEKWVPFLEGIQEDILGSNDKKSTSQP